MTLNFAGVCGGTDLMRDAEQPRSAMVEDASPARVQRPEVPSGERQGVWGASSTYRLLPKRSPTPLVKQPSTHT